MRQLKITKQFTNRDAQSFSNYLAEVSAIPLISAEEEGVLAARIKDGDATAIDELARANLRFVISVAKQYNSSASLQDLVQEGNVGLIKAAERFDASKGFKFISYAVWWIRQSIMQYISESGREIRLPLNKISVASKINVATSELEQILERMPTPFELSEYLIDNEIKSGSGDPSKFTEKKIIELLEQGQSPSSLDAPMSTDNDSSTISDLIEGEYYADINMKNNDLGIELGRFLDGLPSREKNVLIMHFGLFGQKQRSLDDIGEVFGLTRERVRQIREKSLRKIRARAVKTSLKEYR